jgi:hypothetical protein
MERKVTNYGTVCVNQEEYYLDRSLAGKTVKINETELSATTSKGEFKLSPLPFCPLGSRHHDAKQISQEDLQPLLCLKEVKLGNAVRSLAEKHNVHPVTISRALNHLRRSQSASVTDATVSHDSLRQCQKGMYSGNNERLDALLKMAIEQQKYFYGFWKSLLLLFQGYRFEKTWATKKNLKRLSKSLSQRAD